MHPLDFCYWLQGFAEMTEGAPSEKQWALIKEHLATVFNKKTPPLGGWTDKDIDVAPAPTPAPMSSAKDLVNDVKVDPELQKALDRLRESYEKQKTFRLLGPYPYGDPVIPMTPSVLPNDFTWPGLSYRCPPITTIC